MRYRLLLAAVGVVVLTLLGTARMLSPDQRGFGTHQQLGVSPCAFMTMTGYRCPSCGMTTSWAHLMRGNLLRAATANAGGLLLGLAAMFVVVWALASAAAGRLIARRYAPAVSTAVVLAVIALAGGQWIVRFILDRA